MSQPVIHKSEAQRVAAILGKVKALAAEYYRETGRPLGATAEIAEFEAARILGLDLASVRQPGYDAVRAKGQPKRIQIKGRRLVTKNPGQRIGKIDMKHPWDSVMLVLLGESFQATAIYEAAGRR
jgi:hypothetical protein